MTSDRGRGWVPAEAFLPADVVMPWSHDDSARWEGALDPARVIVEYAAAAGGSDEDFTDLAFTIDVEVVEGAIPTQQISEAPTLSLLAVGAMAAAGRYSLRRRRGDGA